MEKEIRKYKNEWLRKWRKEHPIENRAKHLLDNYNHKDKILNRGKGDLTAQWIVDNIFTKPCKYCGKEGWNVIGCNRIDNDKPHTKDNVEPCCKECNDRLAKDYFRELKSKQTYQYTIGGELITIWSSAQSAAMELGFDKTNIVRCCNHKQKTYKGYRWSYKPL